jgi:hypothetical protein
MSTSIRTSIFIGAVASAALLSGCMVAPPYYADSGTTYTTDSSGYYAAPQGYTTDGTYPSQGYPTESYPAQSYPTESYPAQPYATQPYPTDNSYPNQGYTTEQVYTETNTIYAPTAPPAPVVEVQPALPFIGAIWINGFWNWSGGRYSWVPGRYERGRPGYRYEPRRWMKSSRGWQMRGGWRR